MFASLYSLYVRVYWCALMNVCPVGFSASSCVFMKVCKVDECSFDLQSSSYLESGERGVSKLR